MNHAYYGTLFAAIVRGAGHILTNVDEEGNDIPFFTTEQILRELMRFGFYITYDEKANLPTNVITFLATLDNLGYDKITKVIVVERDKDGSIVKRPQIIIMKSYQDNDDLLTYGCEVSRYKLNEKLNANSIMNVTHEDGINWDWVTYIANIYDILEENITTTDEFSVTEFPESHCAGACTSCNCGGTNSDSQNSEPNQSPDSNQSNDSDPNTGDDSESGNTNSETAETGVDEP